MTTKITKGSRLERYRTGSVREVVGFTRKPDGIKRARLSNGTSETRVRLDQIAKSYRLV